MWLKGLWPLAAQGSQELHATGVAHPAHCTAAMPPPSFTTSTNMHTALFTPPPPPHPARAPQDDEPRAHQHQQVG